MEIHLTEKQRDNLFVVLLIVAGLFMFGTIYMIGNHIEIFQKDPFRYGATQLGNAECTCLRYDNDGSFLYSFSFNSTNIWNTKQKIKMNGFLINGS